jgi:hypothetical protein
MAKEVAYKVTVDTSQVDKSTKKTEKSIKDLGKQTEKTSNEMKSGFKSAGESAKQMGGPIGGAATAMTNLQTSVMSSVKALKSLKVALLATGIGAFLVVLGAVAAAFKDSEEGQNKFNKLMTVLGVITGNIRDLFADLGEKIIWAFENPKQAINDFVGLIRDNIETRLNGLLNLIPNIGKAMEMVFEGDFKGAAKVAVDSAGQIALGMDSVTDSVNNAIDATKEFIEVTQEEMEQGAKVADMRAKADKLERDLLVERSKLEGEIAELRLKARQEDQFSAEERKNALLEARELQNNLLEQETEVLQLRAEAQTLENTFARSNKENLDEEAKLIAAVNRQKATRLNQERQLQRELNTINNQLAAESKRIRDEEIKAIEEQSAAELELEKQLQDAKIALIEQEEQREIEKANLALERKLEKIQGDSELEKDLRAALTESTEAEINAIKEKYRLENLKKQEDANQVEIQAQQDLANAKISAATQTGNALGQLADFLAQQGEAGVAASKIFAMSEILINMATSISSAIAGATAAAAAGGPAAPFLQASYIASMVATVVSGISQATATLSKVPSGGSVSAPQITAPSATAPTIAPPTTNTTELGNTQQAELAPIQAFVVETQLTGTQNDVSQIEGQAEFG